MWGAGVKSAGVKSAGVKGAGASVWRVIFGALALALAMLISGCIKQDALDPKVAASKAPESKIDSSKAARAESSADSSQNSAESNLDSSKESTQDTLTPQDLEVKDQQIYVAQTDADDTARACRAPIITRAKLSFVGDIVLGDYKGASGATFNAKFAEVKDYAYFSRGVREVLSSDDLTIGNMEGVLSDKNLKNAFEKPFSFKGQSGYTKILEIASIEALNVANNHSRDYGKQGFIDTVENLIAASRAVFGEGIVHIYEVNDVKFGLAGHRGWNPAIKSQVKKEIDQLKKDGADVVILTFHWGEERQHYPNATQRDIAHFAIDSGADMVVGHHPHVLQGVEEYKGKKIVYSLGNFIYGGAKNPNDKDSMIYQSEFLQISSHAQAVELAKQIEGYLSKNGGAVGGGADSRMVDSGVESSEAESSQNADKNSAKSDDNADKKNKKSKKSKKDKDINAESKNAQALSQAPKVDSRAECDLTKEAYNVAELGIQGEYIKGVKRVDVVGDFVIIHTVLPVSISSTPSYNDYSPIVYSADSKGYARIMQRLEQYSKNNAATPKSSTKTPAKSTAKTPAKSSAKSSAKSGTKSTTNPKTPAKNSTKQTPKTPPINKTN